MLFRKKKDATLNTFLKMNDNKKDALKAGEKHTAIVVGGAGFIGSNLTRELLERGYEVHVVDDLSGGFLEKVDKRAHFHKTDMRDYPKLLETIKAAGPAYALFHLAARPRVRYSIDFPQETHDVNVNGTFNVFLAAKEAGVRRIVYSASSSAYGDQPILPLREDMLPNPKSPYGAQKFFGEVYAKVFAEVYGIETVSLRYFNVYGPGQNVGGAYALVIGTFLQQKKDGKPMTITGDGTQSRAFTHVRDVVRANILAAESPNVGKGEVINIGVSQDTSVNAIAELIGGPVVHIEARLEPKHTAADNSRARELLGWKPEVKIEEGIAELKKIVGVE